MYLNKWREERAWQWYNSRPWIMGCNHVTGSVRNRIEMWQDETFAESLRKTEREFELAARTGFNAIRVMLPFFVWKHQREKFLEHLKEYVECASRNGLGVMIVLFNDCLIPKRIADRTPPPKFGPQPDPDWGYHGGTKVTPFDGSREVGWWDGDDPAIWPEKEAYVRDLVGLFGRDERILMWDIWNEPGNNNRETRSLPLMEKVFGWVRELNPIQPLTACAWDFEGNYQVPPTFYDNPMSISAVERRAIELSDIITFHCYGKYDNVRFVTEQLKKFHRPIMNTEWLHRILHNNVEDILPYFAREHIGSFHWGLVNGYGQFHEPWEFLRSLADKHDWAMDRWQHDIYRSDFTPYDEKEIAIFKAYAPRQDIRDR